MINIMLKIIIITLTKYEYKMFNKLIISQNWAWYVKVTKFHVEALLIKLVEQKITYLFERILIKTYFLVPSTIMVI